MKKIIFLFLILVCLPNISYSSDSCTLVDTITQRREKQIEKAKSAFEEAIKLPDKEDLENCISGIRLNDLFSLGLPSLEELFQMFCNYANSLIDTELADFQNQLEFNPLPGFSFSGSTGLSRSNKAVFSDSENAYGMEYSSDVRMQNRSGELGREIIGVIEE